MDDKVAAIQARLRAQMSQKMDLPSAGRALPVVSFERVGNIPRGAERVVECTVAELAARGHRVGVIRRFAAHATPSRESSLSENYLDAGSVATAFALPGLLASARTLSEEPTFDQLVDALGSEVGVVVAESFGYLAIPKIIVGQKPSEAFSLGLPRIVACVTTIDPGPILVPRFEPGDVSGIADFIESSIITGAGGKTAGGSCCTDGSAAEVRERIAARLDEPMALADPRGNAFNAHFPTHPIPAGPRLQGPSYREDAARKIGEAKENADCGIAGTEGASA